MKAYQRNKLNFAIKIIFKIRYFATVYDNATDMHDAYNIVSAFAKLVLMKLGVVSRLFLLIPLLWFIYVLTRTITVIS